MQTITPFELQVLIGQRDVELIDVRPEKDFTEVHALGARSIPLSRFEPHSVLAHRKLDRRAPLYIMSRERALASLAACSLSSAGLAEPVVVEGGIEAWEGQCLPMVRNKPRRRPVMNVFKVAMLAGFAAGFYLVLRGFVLFAPFVAFTIAAIPHAFRLAHHRDRHVDDPTPSRPLAESA